MKTLTVYFIIFFALNALTSNQKPIGFLTKVKGKIIIINNLTQQEVIAETGTKIYYHSSIQTLKEAQTKLILKNGTIINIAENSFIEIEKLLENKDEALKTSINLFYGKIRAIITTDKQKNFNIKTPAAVMGVR